MGSESKTGHFLVLGIILLKYDVKTNTTSNIAGGNKSQHEN